ncbi:MAG: glucose-1-phosphate thymidylyltransferase [Muribaculaceae bacterium]|nr:glucose-1-phosphate thymidylyltransferase [Muribaculaceae bacterium]
MNNIILYDSAAVHADMLPLSFTRPVSDFRVGITTISEKWQSCLPGTYSVYTAPYLRDKFRPMPLADNLFVAANTLPSEELAAAIHKLATNQAIVLPDGEYIAFRGSMDNFEALIAGTFEPEKITFTGDCTPLHHLYDIFLNNGKAIISDYLRLTAGRESRPLPAGNMLIGSPTLADGSPAIFIEEGASVSGAILNVTDGPIYIGKDATIQEGSCVRGPMALCEHARINMSAKIYSDTTLGPYVKVGGELNNVVIFGYSNKAHDGYLGNAVIGEWCNIGAGTNASNLKNDYSKIRLWNYPKRSFLRTDLQFCGLFMGDHSKAGINCMFNTATVVGVGCNLHGAGYQRPFIPSFSEGSPQAGFKDVNLVKFFDIAERAMSRRGIALTELDRRIFKAIFDVASTYKR